MLGTLVLCSPSEHVFCCTLLTLQCACVNEWNAMLEASEELCSAVLRWPHTAYGRNLSGVYTDLPMPRGTQWLLWEPTRNGQSVWTKHSYLSQTFRSLWPFHNSLRIRSTNLIYRILDFQGTWIYTVTVHSGLGPKLGLVVKKAPSLARRRRQWHPTPVLLPGKSHG